MSINSEPVPPPPDDPHWSNDKKAAAEERNWDQENKLKGQKQRNYLLFLRVYGWIPPVLVMLLAVAFLASFSSWLWHYITPTSWHWLDSEQLGKIQSVIFSSALGGVVSFILQKTEK